jgi:hypothetical protein
MYNRAMAGYYDEALNLYADGETAYDDDKIIDRIQDKRNNLLGWLLQAKTQQPGLYADHQYCLQEAAKRFLSDTDFVNDIEEN